MLRPGIVYVTRVCGHTHSDNKVGTLYSIKEQGRESYEDDELVLVRWSDGSFSSYDDPCIPIALNELTLAQLDMADDEVNNLASKRDFIAKQRSNGDSLLERIILLCMYYRDSEDVSPRIHEGIEFYKVGHNSTHDFYAGRSEGRTYKLSETWNSGEVERHMYSYDDGGLGYCGHH